MKADHGLPLHRSCMRGALSHGVWVLGKDDGRESVHIGQEERGIVPPFTRNHNQSCSATLLLQILAHLALIQPDPTQYIHHRPSSIISRLLWWRQWLAQVNTHLIEQQ